MTFNLRQLETFLWVATLGNFRQTAERLHTTQPAISARIAALESDLGAPLFERGAGPVRLTAKGQELLPYAEKVLRSVETLREKAGDKAIFSGVLRLGVSETIVHTLLPRILNRLHEDHPAIDVEITVDATISLRNELVARSLDTAFLMGPVSEYSVENYDLASFPLVWAAAPSLRIERSGPVRLEDLARFPLLTYARNTRPFTELKARLAETAELPARLFPSSSLAAMLRMSLDGVGIATLPRQMIETELAEGKLREIACDWMPTDLRFTASFASEPYNPVAAYAAELAHRTAKELGFQHES